METGGPLIARLREFPDSASGCGWREHPGSGRVPAPARHPVTKLAGRGLLRLLVTSFPDDFNAKIAMEQLGGSLAEEGRLAEAERALRETLRMCAQNPAARSGTSGLSRVCPRRSALSGQGGGGARTCASPGLPRAMP
jgi:hypothetical protein